MPIVTARSLGRRVQPPTRRRSSPTPDWRGAEALAFGAVDELADWARGHGRGDRIARLAARQHGAVARQQLLALGCSSAWIDRERSRGRLHRLHQGVYALGHARLDAFGSDAAALLACGRGSALADLSATARHGLRSRSGRLVHVVVGPSGREGHADVVIRRSRRAPEVVEVDGLPCTTVSRTLVDIAAHLSSAALERVLDRAEELRLFDLAALDREIALAGGAAGTRVLRDVLVTRLAHGLDVLRSVLEREFRDLMIARRGIRPIMNSRVRTKIGPLEVDARIGGLRLAIELDGATYHRSLRARARDAERDQALAEAGWEVLRLSWYEVVVDPDAGLRRIDAAVARHAAAPPGA